MRKARGVVAAGHEVTAEAAAEILQDGGNAFDAAVAAVLVACVPEVVLCSIGGGGFLMAHVAERRRTLLYDFFPQTPRIKRPEAEIDLRPIHADFGPARQEFHIGLGATATPGLVQGLFAVHADVGRLPMRRLAEPAVRIAREGVVVSDFHAYLFKVIAPILTASAGARQMFAPGGELLKAGDVYRNVALADALEALAHEGPRLFTEGEIARAIVDQSQSLGGHLTLDDLKHYKVERREPLLWRHRDARIWLNPAPAAGGALIAYSLALAERLRPEGALSIVELARVMAETNAVRARWGDVAVTMPDAATIARELERAAGHAAASRGTTHVSIIDADGNAAAATISNGEGNGHIVDGLGFMLNNMLGEDDLMPEGLHRWRPDSRLSSMMAPSLLRTASGDLYALGSGGSNRIRSAILQVIVNLLDRGLALEEAVLRPRLHVERDGTVSFEDLLSEEEREALLAAYPDARAWPQPNMFFGGVHTVRSNSRGGLEGMGDPRRRGVSAVV